MSLWLQILLWGIATMALAMIVLLVWSFFQWLLGLRSKNSTASIES